MRSNLREARPAIADQWHPTKNAPLTPDMVGVAYREKVWWQCPLNPEHIWEAQVVSRTRLDRPSDSCPFCSNKLVCSSNSLAAVFPEIASQWHPTKNGETTAADVPARSDKKAWFLCPAAPDHEWETQISTRTKKTQKGNCPFCIGYKACLSNCLATMRPDLAAEWHPTLNGALTPYDVTSGVGRKVWWQCLNNSAHFWPARINHRSQPNNPSACPKCSESKGEKAIRTYLEEHGIPYKREHSISAGRPDFFVWNQRIWVIEFQGIQHYLPTSFGSKAVNAGYNKLEATLRGDLKKAKWCREKKKPLFTIPFWDLRRISEILDAFFANTVPVFSRPPTSVRKHAALKREIIERLKREGLS